MARPGLTDHPKFSRLMQLLKEPEPHVWGYLEEMWKSAYQNGDDLIGDSETVEAVCKWPGEPGKLTDALAQCGGKCRSGFIEQHPEREGVYLVHDLFDHAPEYVQKRMERESERIKRGKTISDVRRDAVNKRWKNAGKTIQTDTTEFHLNTNVIQTDTNGDTPAPAPAPAHKTKSKPSFSDEDFETAQWMFSKIVEILPKAKQPDYGLWARDIRLMREVDKKTDEEIREVFSWANSDNFWRANILSPSKLRKQFDRLVLQMGEKKGYRQESDDDDEPEETPELIEWRRKREEDKQRQFDKMNERNRLAGMALVQAENSVTNH